MNARSLALLVCLLATVPFYGVASETSLAPRKGVLVLRNGRTLDGHITSVGDYFIVTFANHAEVRLPVAEVEMRCRDLEDAYGQQRDRVPPGDVAAHLALASWCLNQDLLERAADQLLMAFTLAPDHDGIPALERRLLFAARASANAVAEQGTALATEASTTASAESLPRETVEQFTQRVQPVLVNRCASNACHGIRSHAEFRLLRPAKGTAMPTRYTQRNLQAALAFIDREDPAQSPLLNQPIRAHGGLTAPVFDDREQDQLHALAVWIQQIANSSSSVPEGNGESYPTRIAAHAEKVPDGTNGQEAGPDASGWQPNPDPLDPEIFNQRYGKHTGSEPAPPAQAPANQGAAGWPPETHGTPASPLARSGSWPNHVARTPEAGTAAPQFDSASTSPVSRNR